MKKFSTFIQVEYTSCVLSAKNCRIFKLHACVWLILSEQSITCERRIKFYCEKQKKMCYVIFFVFFGLHIYGANSSSTTSLECFIGLRSGGCQGHFDTTELCLDSLKTFSNVHNPAGSNTKPVKYCSTVVIYIYAAAAEIKSHWTGQHFSNLLLLTLGEPVQTVASFPGSSLTGVAPS